MAPVRFRFQTIEVGDADIHLRTLRDRQQFDDIDGAAEALGVSPSSWPLTGVLWECSRVLAELMAERKVEGLRILEVGCGIGLVSLCLNQRNADISASDHNPSAKQFLDYNTNLNDDGPIPFFQADWQGENAGLGEFDLILGSDLLYERDHAATLSAFISRHSAAHCEVIIVDPGRGHRNRYTRNMEELGYVSTTQDSLPFEGMSKGFTSRVLTYKRATSPG